MGMRGMWSLNAMVLAMLIVANLAMSYAGEALWIAVDALALLGAMYFSFRQGMSMGHGACGVSNTVESARRAGDRVYAQLDRKYLAQMWSPLTGVKGVLVSALIPYATGCLYIVLTLLTRDAPETPVPVLVARVAAWLLSLPWWPTIMHWHADFVTLTPAIAAMLMITPFLLPLCTFAGYMRGPKLWERTEEAMKQGRRRAKARARVGKKLAPKKQKPEI